MCMCVCVCEDLEALYMDRKARRQNMFAFLMCNKTKQTVGPQDPSAEIFYKI